jgi:hypothetical protein
VNLQYEKRIFENKNIKKMFTLNRLINENVEVALTRLKNNLEKEIKTKAKKKNKTPAEVLPENENYEVNK